MAFYVACMIFVLSFILFEVLDVDGSDFPVPTGRNATLRATTTEEHADAMRLARSINAVAPLLLIGLLALAASSSTRRRITSPSTTAARAVIGRRYRTPLARAILPAPAV